MSHSIDPISPLWSQFPSQLSVQPAQNPEGNLFSDIFQYAIENVVQADAEKNGVEYLLATGQLDNPAELSLATSKMELSVNLLVQLRNKALDAYNELMRIGL